MAASYDFALKPHPTIPKPEGPLLVCVLDGYGEVWAGQGKGVLLSLWQLAAAPQGAGPSRARSALPRQALPARWVAATAQPLTCTAPQALETAGCSRGTAAPAAAARRCRRLAPARSPCPTTFPCLRLLQVRTPSRMSTTPSSPLRPPPPMP